MHQAFILVCCFRDYAVRIKRPYEVRYDPYTSSIVVLNDKRVLKDLSDALAQDMEQLNRAMATI